MPRFIRYFMILAALPLMILAAQADPLLTYAAQSQPGGPFSLYWTNTGGRTVPLAVQGPLGNGSDLLEYDFAPGVSNVIYRAYLPPSGPPELDLGGTYFASPGQRLSLPLASGRSVSQYALSTKSPALAYIADGQSAGVFEVYLTRLDGTLPVQKVNATPVSGGNVVKAEVSPDGRWMAYRGDLATDGKFEVFASAIPTTSTWNINLPLAADDDVINFAFAPNSARLAFLVNQSNGFGGLRHRLFTRAIQGTDVPTPIADTGAGIGDVVDYKYSPFGSKIALLEDRDTSGQFELYLTNSSGSGGTAKISAALAADKDVQIFAFSPDGNWLAYKSNVPGPFAAQGELFLYSFAAGGAPAKVNQDAAGNADAFIFSPDSKNLVYQQAPSGSSLFNLFVRPVNLSAPERMINGVASAGQSIDAFVIGADSQTVAYIGDASNVGTLYQSRLDGTGIERQVNPPGQSVAAVLAAPIELKAAADGGWNLYR